ncbi:MAG: DUF3617 domain-containing protein, partial [Ignavibacteria bacterium]|nr:DUF3617 domain-containing protein [Ignavibacteria bacterium]
MRLNKLCISIITCGIISSCLANGLVINLTAKSMREKENIQNSIIYISGKNMNMQVYSGENTGYMIFRGDKELFWAVNPKDKECTEITKAAMEKMGQSMSSALAQMEAQMATMPPEQRAMMEQMMKSQMGMGSRNKTEETVIKKTSEKKQVNGYSCVKYEAYKGSEKTRDLWVTDWQNFKHGKEASEAFQTMAEFFKSLMEAFKDNPFIQSFDNPYSQTSTLNGFPVMTLEYEDGKAVLEVSFKSIEKKAL